MKVSDGRRSRVSDKPPKRVVRLAWACALAGIAAAGAAQETDPLKSAACAQAIAALQSARGGGADAQATENLRASAAATCLGSAALPQRPARVVQPPVSVPPPQIDLPAQVAPQPSPIPAPPPVAIGRPPTPALCDAGGCWASDGTHLRHVGPDLGLPQGQCTRQGALLACP